LLFFSAAQACKALREGNAQLFPEYCCSFPSKSDIESREGTDMPKLNRRRADQKHKIWRRVLPLVATIPMGIAAAALLLFAFRLSLPAQFVSALNITAYILSGVGMALSAGFNRSRVFIFLFLLALGQFVLTASAPAGYDARTFSGVVFYLACVLLPANILLFSLLKERGLLTPQGKVRLMVVAVQLVLAVVVIVSRDREIFSFISRELASPPFGWPTPVPATAFALFSAAVLLLGLRQLFRTMAADNALMATLLMLAAALHFKDIAVAIPIFFSAAAVILIVTAIRDSYSIAYMDELTGLPARRSLQEELSKLSGQYVIAMADIDYFKKINDKYGHSVGDDVLRFVAAVFNSEASHEAETFRYGGEEFTLLFAGQSIEEVLPQLEELRQRIAKRGFFLRGKSAEKRLAVTISIGLAQRDADHRTPEEVIKAADAALYRAKGNGRNCVSL
jgi:diguanylate cyclase (GGDEF)-like protein